VTDLQASLFDVGGVFFDLYGTLLIYGDMVAAWADWLTALYEPLRERGLTTSRETFASQCDGFFGRPEPPSRGHGLTVYERRILALCTDLELAPGIEAIREIATATIVAWGEYVFPDPDAISVLGALKESKTLALISNFDHPPHVHSLLADLGLIEFFKVIVVSGDVGVKKPDPHIFSLALRQTGLQPHEVVYVGDAVEDVEGARAAGIRPIRIRRSGADGSQVAADFKSDQQYAEGVIDNVQMISSLLELVES
jgi:HAD superfamily hydrolase (TIGR01549 family)